MSGKIFAMMKIVKLIIFTTVLLIFPGCEDFNTLTIDPNKPTDVSPALLLPNIEVGAFSQVSVSAAYASRYLVFTDGYSTDQAYGWQRAGFGRYNSILQVYKMMQEAEKRGFTNFVALGKFFRAYHFFEMTRTFGEIPYKEAMQGDEGVFKPAYDSQEDVFLGILNELDEAESLLSETAGEISGDVIYDGDILKWKKLINSFKIKVLINLSAKEGNTDLNVVSRFREIYDNPDIHPVFSSLEDQAQLVFVDRDDNRYPLFHDKSSQTAVYLEKSFVDLLKLRKDPRLFLFGSPEKRAVENGQPGYQNSFSSFGGLDAGAYVNDNVQTLTEKGIGSPLNERYYMDPVAEPSIAVGYPELLFNLAEAAYRGWITASPEEFYTEGITASLKFYGIIPARINAYLSGSLVVYDETKALDQINTQKYLSYFLNTGWESFYNQRRTGIPVFEVGPATQNGGEIPKRWMYPQSELDYNFDNVAKSIQRQYNGNDNVNGIMWLLIPE